jgi:hypothetical protein
MEALTRHSLFLGSSSLSLAQRFRTTPISRIFAEILIIVLFFGFTVKTESFLSFYIIQPLLKKLFGDNDELRREVEQREGELQRMMDDHKNGRLPGQQQRTGNTSSSMREAKEVD